MVGSDSVGDRRNDGGYDPGPPGSVVAGVWGSGAVRFPGERRVVGELGTVFPTRRSPLYM
jgi:hypothetical protein